MEFDSQWTLVNNIRKKRTKQSDTESCEENNITEKISEPCWFYNNGGCRHKDSTEKSAAECKYLHIYSENVKRPPHLGHKKPCDKFNLEGDCKWNENCKYSHRILTMEEWNLHYPNIPFNMKPALPQKDLNAKMFDVDNRIKILEYKQKYMSEEIQTILHALKIHKQGFFNKLDSNHF